MACTVVRKELFFFFFVKAMNDIYRVIIIVTTAAYRGGLWIWPSAAPWLFTTTHPPTWTDGDGQSTPSYGREYAVDAEQVASRFLWLTPM